MQEARARFRLKAIVALEGLAADPDLTPPMPGVTDRLSIGDWNAPFPFDSHRVRKQDEQYWDDHRTTPKAFISLAAGRQLWSSRFGETTAIRFARAAGSDARGSGRSVAAGAGGAGFRVHAREANGIGSRRGHHAVRTRCSSALVCSS